MKFNLGSIIGRKWYGGIFYFIVVGINLKYGDTYTLQHDDWIVTAPTGAIEDVFSKV